MRTFTDNQGREWNLSITTFTVKMVKERTGVLLTKAFESGVGEKDGAMPLQTFAEWFSDATIYGPVLWELCRKQAEAANIGEESFLDSIEGDALGAAALALARAIADFSSSPEQRKALLTGIEKMVQLGTVAIEMLTNQMDAVEIPTLSQMESDYMQCVSSAPGSSGSPPGITR